MDEKTLRALVEAGAVKRIRIIADGARFHVEADTPASSITVFTLKGSIKPGARWIPWLNGCGGWGSVICRSMWRAGSLGKRG